MTEKRFKLIECLPNVIQIKDNNQKLNSHEIVDLLNELNDECEFLKIDNEALEDGATKYAKLSHKSLKENEELKKLLKCSRKEANDYCEELMEKDEFIRLYKRQRDEVIEENKQLKKDNEWLFKCVENQSALIQELDSTIMAYNMEHKIIIKLTEKELRTLDKALSYYTHQEVEE